MKPITLVVDHRIRVSLSDAVRGSVGLVESDVEDLKLLFRHTNPKRAALKAMGVRTWWSEPIYDVTWSAVQTRSAQWLSFPRGGMRRILDYLQERGYHPHVDDRRCDGAGDFSGKVPKHKITLRDYQDAAARAALAAQTGIVRAPTGSGKTELAFAVAAEANLGTLVLVNTRELLDQWVVRAEKALGLKKGKVGVVQGKRRELKAITIAMQQSLHRQGFDDDFARTWGTVIYDEVQLASASSFYEVVDRFPARYRIGVSADNRRKDGKEYLNHDLFGEVVYEIGRDQLVEEGHVLDVEVVVVPTDFRADWYGLPDAKDDDKSLDFKRLSDEMTLDDERTMLGVERVLDEVRLGHQVFVMARRREHCTRIAAHLVGAGVPCGYLIGGEDYRPEFRKTAADMRAGRVQVGVGTVQSIGTGIDFPAVDVAVVMTPLAGNRQAFNQVRGRVCRTSKGKHNARMYYLWDHKCGYGLAHLKNIVAQNPSVTVLGRHGPEAGRLYLQYLKEQQRQRKAAW